ncbi:AMP-binding protein [Streptomyces sp. NPDC029526]|uniref:AMP-binding protein n=1 Tax=Streptomyces sp. NPDC029526 TaxID=3155728 RepID=UPI0033C2CB26
MATAERLHEHVDVEADRATIPGLLRRNARQFADRPALTTGIGPDAGTLTWFQLRAEVAALTRGLAALGVERDERLLIAMSERAEHRIVDLAAVHLGALPCSVSGTLGTGQLRSVARHSAAGVLVVEGEEQLRHWRPVLDDLPALRAVVVLDWAAAPGQDPRFVSYAAVRGAVAPDAGTFETLTDETAPDRPLAVVYPLDAAGAPQGLVHSHRNVVHASLMQDPPDTDTDTDTDNTGNTDTDNTDTAAEPLRTVAYLPMHHITGRLLGTYAPIRYAGHVTLCPDPAQLLTALLQVRPHRFSGTPEVWEELAAGLRAALGTLTGERAAEVERARGLALDDFRLRGEGRHVPVDLAAALREVDERTLRPVRAAVGLDACRLALSDTARLPLDVMEFLASVGLPVYEVWGPSEATGAVTTGSPDAFTPGGLGRPGPGIEVRAADDGMLCVRGPVVVPGRLRADGGLEPVTDADGWLRTGDAGTVDGRGIVCLTDRERGTGLLVDGGTGTPPAP